MKRRGQFAEAWQRRGFAAATAAFAASWLSAVFFLWPGEWALPAGVVSSSSFFIAQLVLPRCRFSPRQLVTPLNWMLLAFGSQLILMPALVRIAGPSVFPLPSLTSKNAINFALLLITLGFWAFCIAVHFFRRNSPLPLQLPGVDKSWIPGRGLAMIFLCLGIAGTLMSFGTLERLVEYSTNPAAFMTYAAEAAGRAATPVEAAGTFLKPFLGFGFLLFWCRAIDLPLKQGERFRWAGRIFLIAIIAISFALMTYNRGSFAVPMVAMIAVISKRLPGRSLRYLMAVGTVFASLLAGVTLYRSVSQINAAGSVDIDSLARAAGSIDVMGTVQEYGQAPQYLGYWVERNHFGATPRAGEILLSSILYPVPVMGKPFRSRSGTFIYNQLMGRNTEMPDQVPQFAGELFLDFHIVGVLLGFGALGWVIARLQSRFDAARSAVEVYILQFAGVWMGFLTAGSIDVIAQIALYSSLPIYLYLFYRARRKKRLLHNAGGPQKPKLSFDVTATSEGIL